MEKEMKFKILMMPIWHMNNFIAAKMNKIKKYLE